MYIDNKDFTRLVLTYQATGEGADELLRSFLLLAHNVCKKYCPKQLEVEDAEQIAALFCWQKVHHFKPIKGPAFNYFTTVCRNAILQEQRREVRWTRVATLGDREAGI